MKALFVWDSQCVRIFMHVCDWDPIGWINAHLILNLFKFGLQAVHPWYGEHILGSYWSYLKQHTYTYTIMKSCCLCLCSVSFLKTFILFSIVLIWFWQPCMHSNKDTGAHACGRKHKHTFSYIKGSTLASPLFTNHSSIDNCSWVKVDIDMSPLFINAQFLHLITAHQCK